MDSRLMPPEHEISSEEAINVLSRIVSDQVMTTEQGACVYNVGGKTYCATLSKTHFTRLKWKVIACVAFVALILIPTDLLGDKIGWFLEVESSGGKVKILGPYGTYNAALDVRGKQLLREEVKSTHGPYYIVEVTKDSTKQDIRKIDLPKGYYVRIEGSNWDLLSVYEKSGKQIAHERVLRNTRFTSRDIAARYDHGSGCLIVAFRAGRNRDIMGAWIIMPNKKVYFSGFQKASYIWNLPIEFPERYTVKFGGNGYSPRDSKTDFSVSLRFDRADKKWQWSGWHE